MGGAARKTNRTYMHTNRRIFLFVQMISMNMLQYEYAIYWIIKPKCKLLAIEISERRLSRWVS